MVSKEYVVELLKSHKTFLVYSPAKKHNVLYFTWDKKNQEYKEYTGQDLSEILATYRWGKKIEMYLEDGELLVDSIDEA
jgi:hypothetical protein